MRRLRLPSVIAGATLTALLLFLVLVFGSRYFPNPAPEGVLLVGPAHQLRVLASVLVPLACALLACFAGGLVAGRLAPDSPELYGASGTALGFLGGFVWFVWGLVPSVFVRPSNPGEVFTRSGQRRDPDLPDRGILCRSAPRRARRVLRREAGRPPTLWGARAAGSRVTSRSLAAAAGTAFQYGFPLC